MTNTKTNYTGWIPTVTIESQLAKRVLLGLTMIAGFCLIIYGGPLTILLMTTSIQVKCFEEIISIAYDTKKIPKESKLRRINWYFLFVANYFFYGELFNDHFEVIANSYKYIKFLVTYHRFISFCIYWFGFIRFVMNIKKNNIRKQFSLFFWAHFLLIIIVLQSVMMVNIVFEGIIWCVVPISLVVMNDIFAFAFGKLLGRRPLIKLSPKKTLEGYIYGALSTIVFGMILSHVLCLFKYFTCPVIYVNVGDGVKINSDCSPSTTFTPIDFVGFKTYPFVFHSLALSIFASIICPFGGFFASGFKRAMKVKDFGDVIPGHGGVMDRNDCQYLMGTFVNVYITTFIRTSDVERIFQKFLYLNDDNQVQFYHLMEDYLTKSGIINSVNNTLTMYS